MERRKFSREFKIEAVKLVRERGVKVAQAARDLDVHATVLRSWVWEFAGDPYEALPGNGQMKPEQLEIERLRREGRRQQPLSDERPFARSEAGAIALAALRTAGSQHCHDWRYRAKRSRRGAGEGCRRAGERDHRCAGNNAHLRAAYPSFSRSCHGSSCRTFCRTTSDCGRGWQAGAKQRRQAPGCDAHCHAALLTEGSKAGHRPALQRSGRFCRRPQFILARLKCRV